MIVSALSSTARRLWSVTQLGGLALLAALASPSAIAGRDHALSPPSIEAERSTALRNYGALPLSFIENEGQVDKRAKFYIHASGCSLFFTPDGHALRLSSGTGEHAKAHVINVELVGAATRRIESRQRATGIVSYFSGPKSEWKAGIPTHARIGYVQPWPGIDLAYDGDSGKLESIYTVAPRADPARIKLRYKGHESMRLDEEGSLVYRTSVGAVKETAPVFYQKIGGKRIRVEGSYRLLDSNTVGFEVAKYDRDHALVIDPTLVYAGYIGGSGSDTGASIAVDSVGNTYLTGPTSSTAATFPTVIGPDLIANGNVDIFVTKVNAAGTALVYSGFIGGSGLDDGRAIAVDGGGNAYVTGTTFSTQATFPVVRGPDLISNGNADAFVIKVNSAGTALVYAGYIGGSQSDGGESIAVDAAGNAYVAGATSSSEATFPVVGGPDLIANGALDGFVAKVSPTGSTVLYAGYLGGSDTDIARAIAVDGAGRVLVVGEAFSTETSFPVIGGPSAIHGGSSDAFIARLSPSGAALEYSGFVGGSGSDAGFGIALDGTGNAYMVGTTASTQPSFPVVGGPDLTHNGVFDAFIAKINPTGSGLVYLGYIGGSASDNGFGIGVDVAGNAYVAGTTSSAEATFPVADGPDVTYNGGTSDAFVAKVRADGSVLDYATYIGGTATDRGFGIAVGSFGNAYVAGDSESAATSFPVVVGPDLVANGGRDAFVAHIREPLNFIFGNGFE